MLAGISSLTRLCGRLRRAATALALPLALAAGAVSAAPPRDTLTLLIPDDADRNSWQVKVWTDSAAEEGIRLETLTDAQFLALGATAATRIPGLIVPDSAHIKASDAIVAAVKSYAFTGGRLMLVYDAGALTDTGFYPLSGNSRFSDLVGVEYVQYNTLRDRVVGFGPITGTRARLESLSLPPGKYFPYVPPASLSSLTTTATTAFVPTSRLDPGGTELMKPALRELASKGMEDGSKNVRRMRLRAMRDALGLTTPVPMPLRWDHRVGNASKALEEHFRDVVRRSPDDVRAIVEGNRAREKGWTDGWENGSGSGGGSGSGSGTGGGGGGGDNDLMMIQISGYAYGPLGYFNYVTTGSFPGTVYLSSAEHGLVAGARSYGSGQVLFVNMPLGYFKAVGTDSAPLHGFLTLFARDHVGVSTMSVQPRGIGGMVYNWHVDDGDDLVDDTKWLLDNTRMFKRGPFSIHFTAGPDVINFGDGNGMDLAGSQPKSVLARDLVQRLGNIGRHAGNLPVQHQLGAHGGWIHDYWGLMANEANSPDLTSLLMLNFDAIERTTGRRITEYSSPQGNTPLWALRWMEARGVTAVYTVGDGGAGAVRSWRNVNNVVARTSNKMWSFPVTPQGKYATFEEFEEFGISDTLAGQWLVDLQSFVVNRRTNRMFYNHPPGARGHLAALDPLFQRADSLQSSGRFHWYTMTQLAEFSQRRVETAWDSASSGGRRYYTARHPSSLADMTWLLPRARYDRPVVHGGTAKVTSDSRDWIVTAESGTSLSFSAAER